MADGKWKMECAYCNSNNRFRLTQSQLPRTMEMHIQLRSSKPHVRSRSSMQVCRMLSHKVGCMQDLETCVTIGWAGIVHCHTIVMHTYARLSGHECQRWRTGIGVWRSSAVQATSHLGAVSDGKAIVDYTRKSRILETTPLFHA